MVAAPEVGVVQAATEHELGAARRRDVARELLEAVLRLVRVLVRQRRQAAKPRVLGNRERIERGGGPFFGRRRLLLVPCVPRHHAFADHIEECGAVVVAATVARREQELAQFDLDAIADRQHRLIGEPPLDRRGVVVLGLAGIARRGHLGDERHALTGQVRQVVVVERHRRRVRIEGAELRRIEPVVRHEVEGDADTAAGDAVDDLDLGDPLLPVEGQPVVVLAEDDAVDDVLASVAIAGAIGEPREERVLGLEADLRFAQRRGVVERFEIDRLVARARPPRDEKEPEVRTSDDAIAIKVGGGIRGAPGKQARGPRSAPSTTPEWSRSAGHVDAAAAACSDKTVAAAAAIHLRDRRLGRRRVADGMNQWSGGAGIMHLREGCRLSRGSRGGVPPRTGPRKHEPARSSIDGSKFELFQNRTRGAGTQVGHRPQLAVLVARLEVREPARVPICTARTARRFAMTKALEVAAWSQTEVARGPRS